MQKRFKKSFTAFVVFTTIVWSLGISALIPNAARAAVTASGAFDLIPSGGMRPSASSFDMPVIKFSLLGAGETLSSVAITVTSTVNIANNNTLADHINAVKVWRDSNGNNYFDPQSDALAGTQSVVKVATSTTVVTTGSNNTIAESGLPTSFFVTISTDAGWTLPDSIYINMSGIAADAISLSSGAVALTALTGSKAISAGGGWGGFSVGGVAYVNATTADVTFTDFLDLNTGAVTSTSNYSFSGVGASAVTLVTLLPDNKSVRVSASGASLVSTGTSLITVTDAVKNTIGIANANTSATVIYSGVKPLVVSEIQAGTALDPFDEFIEIYNRSGGIVPTSSLKLHIVNVEGTVDNNVTLTWQNNGTGIPANGFLLITSAFSSFANSADAIYSTSTALSILPQAALYISNSVASSTAVLDKVCWGTHSTTSNCEGSAASALINDGKSIERKAFNNSTSATMAVGGTDASIGNSVDTQNNNFDFVARTTPLPQNFNVTETPEGGFYGGANNQAPSIFFTSIFRASRASALNMTARISDDGGTPPAGNTMLIYCVSDSITCTPASSTPIYGVSIGSGWYKFSSTSTDWGQSKAYFRYYLQANDSATPAKTRVMTNDPNFDTVTYNTAGTGIQTAALQQSKAFTVNLEAGNLGTAAISGTVQTSAGAAISGATVWIEGTQFAATTGNDGSFSFSNVGPSGGVQIKVAKDGYSDQGISTFLPPSGFVNLGAITLYSGMMGQGGDFSLPQVMGSFPMPGMMGFPTQSPAGGPSTMDLNFNKTIDTTTIVDADASDASSNIYLTEAGSGAKIAGAVTAPTATSARFTPSAALTVGKSYTLFLTPAVKDLVGNPVQGNGPGGVYVLNFGTTGEMYTGGGGASFGTGNAFPPFVVGSQPAPGKANVALNTKSFVTFSDALQNTAGNLANVKLYLVSNPYTASESKTVVSTVNSLDTSNKIVILAPSANLTASSNYRLEVTGGLTSSKGISLGNPGQAGYTATVMYKSDFNTGSSTDTTAPTVNGTIPAASATGVSPTAPIVVVFSEAIDPSTITDSSLSVKLGSSVLAGNLTYDTTSWKATFVPTYALTATSTYTITITTDVKDLAGRPLVLLQQVFTTGSADTSLPAVLSAQANEFALKVSFSKPMLSVTASDSNYASSVLKPANYSIRVVFPAGDISSTLSLPATATLTYDPASRSAAINGLPAISGFIAGTTLLNIVASNVKDIGFNALDTTLNAATTTAQSSAKSGGFGGMMPTFDAGGNMMQGGFGMGGPPPMVGTFQSSGIGFAPGVKVYPFNKMAGASTIYGIEIPISYQVPNAGFVDITFPDGTDVSQAKKDTASPPNSDLNGPGPGVVVFGTSEGTLPTGWTTGGASNDGVLVDATSRKVRVILGAVATRRGSANLTSGDGDQHDFLRLDIAQIVNSTISSGVDTSGSSAAVETKKADGTVLETLSSTSFFTNAAGSYTVRGRVMAGATGLNGVTVFLMSPMTGPMSTTTANSRFGADDGEFMFQNLNTGMYILGADQYFKSGVTSYTASAPSPINVNVTNCVSSNCTQNILATDASTGVAVTLSISGTFSNDAIDIFAGGPGSFRKATSTLNGVLANNTANTIKLNANGIWMVGFGPQMSTEIFGKSGPTAPTTWMLPKPQEVQVSGCPGSCSVNPSTLTFNVSKADNTIKYIVRDASGNAIANAHVFAYSPSSGVGIDSSSNADGTGSITMATGTYKFGADVAGMPSGVDRSIMVKDNKVYVDGNATGIALATMANTDLILTISKPAYTISGKVTDGTNAVANAPINAFRTDGPGQADTFTNSSGEYTLYVGNGAYKVQAFTPDYGKLPEKTITVSIASVSGQNFEPNTSAINYYTFTKSVAVDTNGDGAYVAADDEELSNAQVIVKGTTGDLNNDGDVIDVGENVAYLNSSLTDTNGSSTLKLPPGTYNMEVWSPTMGTVSSTASTFTVSGAGAISSAPADVLAKPTVAITVNLFDENGNTTTTAKAVVEFQLLGGKLDKVESFSNVASSTISLPKYDAGADSVAINNSTSTNPNNFYLMTVDIPGIAASDLIVYGGSSTIMATSTPANGYWKVEVDGTETINIKLPALKFISGTVKDATGAAVPDATVKLENSSTGEVLEVLADTSGNYTGKVSSGTYLVQAKKDGYLDTASSVAISASGALADSATTITAASYTISGTITAGGAAASNATVRAERLGGGTVTATTNSSGVYSLNVIVGDWKVSAAVDGYTEKTYLTTANPTLVSVSTANVSGIDIGLTTTNTTLAGTTSGTVTPQTGGSLSNSSAGFNIGAPSSALGSGANNYSMSAKETSNVVAGGSGTPLANEAKSVTSYDNDSKSVTTLKKDVSVGATYTAAELTTSLGTATLAKIEKIKMASWDETADDWQNLATTLGYKDSSNNFIEPSLSAASVAFTGQTNHFSVFNPIVPSDNIAPNIPANVSAVAGNATVSITWSAVSNSDLLGYEIYRSTTAGGTYTQLNTSNITGTSYTDNSVSNGSTYYYKVSAGDTGGDESAVSSVSNAASPVAPVSPSGGGTIVQPAPILGATAVSVDGGNTVTSYYITLKFSASNAVQMAISEKSDFSNSSWESYVSTKNNFKLSDGPGAKKIYVKFRTALGGDSAVQSIDITVSAGATNEKQIVQEAKTEAKTEVKAVACPLTTNKAYSFKKSRAVFYVTSNCTKRPFSRPDIFFTYFNSWSDVVVLSDIKLLNQIPNDAIGFMPWGPKYDPKYGALVKIVSDAKVYLLLGAKRYWITDANVFNLLKYSWKWIEDISEELLNKYEIGSEITETDKHPSYTLIKYKNNPKVYRLEPNPTDETKQVKRYIKNEKVFKALNFRWDRIVTVDDNEIYSDGEVMTAPAEVKTKTKTEINTGTKYQFKLNLKAGNSGEEVKQLQLKLKEFGYFTYPAATGYFGAATVDAVKKFQIANGFKAVGLIGPQTLEKLNSL